MKVAIKAGAELDLISPREMRAELERVSRDIIRQLTSRPLIRTIEGSVALGATGLGTIRLELPPLADAWDVRRVNVCYQDPTAASVATVVTLFRGGDTTNPFNYIDRNLTGPPAGNVPFALYWASRQLTLRQDEPLLLVVTGGVASANIFASAQVMSASLPAIQRPDLS